MKAYFPQSNRAYKEVIGRLSRRRKKTRQVISACVFFEIMHGFEHQAGTMKDSFSRVSLIYFAETESSFSGETYTSTIGVWHVLAIR
jgi:hypothetical protein